jgi:bacillopeptidase F (M6 metalloprotease family)
MQVSHVVITHRFLRITKISQEASGGSLGVDNITGYRFNI